MRACEGKPGRVFVMRLEDGDIIYEFIGVEAAREEDEKSGFALLNIAD